MVLYHISTYYQIPYYHVSTQYQIHSAKVLVVQHIVLRVLPCYMCSYSYYGVYRDCGMHTSNQYILIRVSQVLGSRYWIPIVPYPLATTLSTTQGHVYLPVLLCMRMCMGQPRIPIAVLCMVYQYYCMCSSYTSIHLLSPVYEYLDIWVSGYLGIQVSKYLGV